MSGAATFRATALAALALAFGAAANAAAPAPDLTARIAQAEQRLAALSTRA